MMKKAFFALVIVFAAGILGFPAKAAAETEVTVGAQTDMVIVPFQFILNDDPKPNEEEFIIGAGAGRFYSAGQSLQGPRARLDLRGSYEDIIGMRARIQARPDGIGIEDYLQAWWQPLEWFRIDAGRFLNDSLRGRINDLDERMSAYNVKMYDGDSIFTRFKTHRYGGQAGLMFSFTINDSAFSGMEDGDEVYIGALLYDLMPMSASAAGAVFDGHPDYVDNNTEAYRNVQAAVGWKIKDFVHLRAQYLGAKPSVTVRNITDKTESEPGTYDFNTYSITAPRVEMAFAFMGVPDAIIDIGGKVPLPFKDWTGPTVNIFQKKDETASGEYNTGYLWQAPYQASLGINLAVADFNFGARVDAKFAGRVEGDAMKMYFGPEVNFHVWPSYNLGVCRIIVDFGFEFIGPTRDQDEKIVRDGGPFAMNGGTRMGLGLSVEKKIVSNCIIKGGFAWKNSGTVNSVQEKMVISVPLFVDWYF
ncbi:MAG: hypothetical protein LBI06_08780 [Treponema sp.]|jgi:hypothetical protein|nr:hypothetical protein [Treponema sp.]